MNTTSPDFCGLCCRIVGEYHGELAELVFKALSQGDRCTVQQIAHTCHLPLKRVNKCLAGLLSLNLVRQTTTPHGSTTYAPNFRGAYQILRVGKLVALVQQKHGEIAARVVEIACGLKYCTVQELIVRSAQDKLIHERRYTDAAIREIIKELQADKFLINFRAAHLKAINDVCREIEGRMDPVTISRITGTQAKLEHEENIRRQAAQLTSTVQSEDGFYDVKETKQTNTELGRPTSPGQDTAYLLIQPNLHQLVVDAQIDRLERAICRTYGQTAAQVLSAALTRWHSNDSWCLQEDLLFDVQEIHALLLSATDARHSTSQGSNGTSTQEHSESNVVIPTHLQIEQHLVRLSEGPYKFLSKFGNAWQIDQQQFHAFLQADELFRLLETRVPDPGSRILRILIDQGKLEERTLQEVGLLSARELRQSLLEMQRLGFVDLQEVPRNPQRQPNQTVFLWAHDSKKVQKHILEMMYKGLLRLLELIDLERSRIGTTLAKVEREDVKGQEKEVLGQQEYAVLSRFRKTENWIWVEIGRLDTSIAILGDSDPSRPDG